jgi:hypothetical protein
VFFLYYFLLLLNIYPSEPTCIMVPECHLELLVQCEDGLVHTGVNLLHIATRSTQIGLMLALCHDYILNTIQTDNEYRR